MKIYGDLKSGNCLKVKWVCDKLSRRYTWVDVDTMKSESRTPEFLRINGAGQVPVLELDDGRTLAQSNAIIRYLARGTDLIPAEAFLSAKMDEWLFWEQYSHEPYVSVCRFHMVYQGKTASEREAWRVERAEAALDHMEAHLAGKSFFVGEALSVADIALLAYTRLAGEGGFDLSRRPNLTTWITRCETALELA